MTFKKAVDGTQDLSGAWRAGLQALSTKDKAHVSVEDPQRLCGSVNVEESLRSKQGHQNAPLWDYAVGHQPENVKGEMVYWIEIHPANQHGVSEVLNKLEWLLQWLKDSAPLLRKMPPAFIWVSSGKTSFTASSPQARKLARAKVRIVGRLFTIPNKAAH